MKMIKMLNLQTEECKDIPTNEDEAILLKRKCFNEGWWKGFTISYICSVGGFIVGTVIMTSLLNLNKEA